MILPILLTRYITNNKEADNDWFRLESNKEGTRWFGKCWHYHNQVLNKCRIENLILQVNPPQLKYEFDVEFDIPVTYPMTSPEIALPELDGKTAKVEKGFSPVWINIFTPSLAQMYRGGKICLTDHFKPLWGRNAPKFGKSILILEQIAIAIVCRYCSCNGSWLGTLDGSRDTRLDREGVVDMICWST